MSIRNVFAIQRQQIVYSRQCSEGNMQRIGRRFLRHHMASEDSTCKELGILRDRHDWQSVQ